MVLGTRSVNVDSLTGTGGTFLSDGDVLKLDSGNGCTSL